MENIEKKWLIIGVIILEIILGVVFGIYAYDRGKMSDTNMIDTQKLADVENNKQLNNKTNANVAIETSSIDMKVSPNAIIIQKRYYKSCDHLIKEVVDVPEDLINKEQEDVIKKYSDWKLEGYSSKEIVIYKEFDGICNEHYVIKEHDGVIGIYTENNEGIQEWQEDTEISTKYLPDTDLEQFKIGTKIVGKNNLYSFLEDYE